MLDHEDNQMTDTAIGQAYADARRVSGGGDRYAGYMEALKIMREADEHKKSFGKRLLARMRSDPDFEADAADLLAEYLRRDVGGHILKDMPAAGDGGRSATDDQVLGAPASADTARAGQTTGDNPAFGASAASGAGHSGLDDRTSCARPLATSSPDAHGGHLPSDAQRSIAPMRDRSRPGHAASRGMRPELGRLCFLDSIRVNNQSLRDVTPDEALRWAEMRKLDARRIEAICFGLHPEKRIGDQITDKDADARAAEALSSAA